MTRTREPICQPDDIAAPTGEAPEIFDALSQRNCLTVSDAEGFAHAGGVIQFVNIDNRIRLQINVDAAKLANLTISSKLLRPAQIVTTGKG